MLFFFNIYIYIYIEKMCVLVLIVSNLENVLASFGVVLTTRLDSRHKLLFA